MLEKYKFPIDVKPVYIPKNGEYQGIIDPENPNTHIKNKSKAIVRADTQEWISTVTENYEVVTNGEVINNTVNALEALDFDYNISHSESFLTNKRMRLVLEIPELKFNEGTSDVEPTIDIRNSYNYSEGVRILMGAIREVCNNGMLIMKTVKKFYHKHTKGIQVEKIQERILEMRESIPEVERRIQELQSRQPDKKLMDILREKMSKTIIRKAGLDEEQDKNEPVFPDIDAEKLNQYRLYNLMTYIVSHEIAKQSRTRYQQRLGKIFEL
jgi:hypothetical protein